MFSDEKTLPMVADFFNYHAISLLEAMGKDEPTELEINIVETELRAICSHKEFVLPALGARQITTL